MARRLDSDDSNAPASVCEEVCVLLSSVVDGRATSTEAAFANAHLSRCSSCASYYAFLKAEKAALTRQPMAMPSSALSARIAAATYRRPTFSERIVGFLAFLQPIPVRVAVGVAAVAGIAMLVVPRVEVNTVAETHKSTPSVSTQPAEETTPVVTVAPKSIVAVAKTAPVKKTVTPATKPMPVIAVPAPDTTIARSTPSVPETQMAVSKKSTAAPDQGKPSRVVPPVLKTNTPVQVAFAHLPHAEPANPLVIPHPTQPPVTTPDIPGNGSSHQTEVAMATPKPIVQPAPPVADVTPQDSEARPDSRYMNLGHLSNAGFKGVGQLGSRVSLAAVANNMGAVVAAPIGSNPGGSGLR